MNKNTARGIHGAGHGAVITSMTFRSRMQTHRDAVERTRKNKALYKAKAKEAQIRERVKAYMEGKLGDDLTDTKVLGWDPNLAINTVLTLGDLSTANFGVDPETQKVVITDTQDTNVFQRTISCDIFDLMIRRMDNRIVYTGTGKEVPRGASTVETPELIYEAGIIPENFCPSKVVCLALRAGDKGLDSGVYVEIRPNGEVWMYGDPTLVIKDIPCSASHIIYVPNQNENQIIYGQNYIKLDCTLQEDLIVYTGSGKDSSIGITPNDDSNPYYTEIQSTVGMGVFGPHTDGPVIALRTVDEANTSAYVRIVKSTTQKTDGTIDYTKSSVQLVCKSYDLSIAPLVYIRHDAFVTSAFMDTYIDKPLEYSAISIYGSINFRLDDADGKVLVIYFDPSKASGGVVPTLGSGGSIVILDGSAVEEQFRPDRRVTIDLMTEGCYIEVATDGTVTIKNASSQTQTLTQTCSSTVTHINKGAETGTLEQIIQHPAMDIILRKNDADIVVEVEPKATTITPGTDIEIAQSGAVDESFRPTPDNDPDTVDGDIVVTLNPLSTGQDNFLKIKSDGSITMTATTSQLETASIPSVAYEKAGEGDDSEEKFICPEFELTVRADGDIHTYEVKPTSATIAATTGVIAPTQWTNSEFLPEHPIILHMDADPDVIGAVGSTVTIQTDGTVNVTAGTNVDTEKTFTAYGMEQSTSITSQDFPGVYVKIYASKSNETVVYQVEKTAEFPSGDSVDTGVTLVSPYIPDEEMTIPLPTTDGGENAWVTISTAGVVNLHREASASIELSGPGGTVATGMNINETVNVDAQEIEPEIVTTVLMSDGSTHTITLRPLKLKLMNFGQRVLAKIKGLGQGIPANKWVGKWCRGFLPAGSIRKEFRPAVMGGFVNPPICCRMPAGFGRAYINADGSMDIKASSEAAKTANIATQTVETTDVVVQPENIAGQQIVINETAAMWLCARQGGKASVGSWIKMRLRKLKNVVCTFLKGNGGFTTGFTLGGQKINLGIRPDLTVGVDVNPGGTGNRGSLTLGPDGGVNFNVNAGGLTLTGSKKFTLPFNNLGDTQNSRLLHTYMHHSLRASNAMKEYALYMDSEEEGGMQGHFYDIELTPAKTSSGLEYTYVKRELRVLFTRSGIHLKPQGFFKWLGGKIKGFFRKIDVRKVVTKVVKAAGSFVTNLVSGKGIANSAIEAGKELISGGLSSIMKTDTPIAVPTKTAEGKTSSFTVADANGKLTTTSIATVAAAAQPCATGFINVESNAVATPTEFMRLMATDTVGFVVEDVITVECVKHGQVVSYNVKANNRNVKSGATTLKKRIPAGLTPRAPITQFISANASVTIDVDGSVTINATKEHNLSSVIVPMTAILLPMGFEFRKI